MEPLGKGRILVAVEGTFLRDRKGSWSLCVWHVSLRDSSFPNLGLPYLSVLLKGSIGVEGFRKLGVHYFGVLVIRIRQFRVLY